LEEYSTGNLQRLKLAAALVHDPQLLLLDEPTNGLDPSGRMAMLRLLEDLIAETGKSLILCTHLLGDVERLCEQIVVLHRGSAIRAGVLRELRQQTAGRFELAWQGDGLKFCQELLERGVEVAADGASPPSQALVTTPSAWNTASFFELARASGIVLTKLKPQEEDLEQLFFRLTEYVAPASHPLKHPSGDIHDRN
jgi:ABC-2 type transport system ATP-binding protein